MIKLNSKSQIWPYLEKTDIDSESWIVSKTNDRDLMSAHILSNQGYFLDQTIQMNRVFFRNVHKSVFPDYTIVSRGFAEAFLKRKMLSLKSELSLDIVDHKSRLRSMTYFASLLLDPDLDEGKLQEWLSVSEERKLRLKPDLLLNELFLSFFVDQKIICEDWLLAHLQNADLSQIFLPVSRLYFDLGPEYTLAESTIVQKLAKNYEIIVFQIVHDFDKQFSHLLQAYERFDILETKSNASVLSESKDVQLKKFSSAISECRFAIAQIKKWKDSGFPIATMAIVAPEIEKYQTVISWLLMAEDLPVNQSKKASLLEFNDIRLLLSDLSFFKTEIEFSTIRESLIQFHSDDRGRAFHYLEEKLNSQFNQSEDLLTLINSEMPQFFIQYMGMSLASLIQLRSLEMNAVEFLKATQVFWERSGLSERKEKIISAVYSATSLVIKLTTEEWVEQVEQTAQQTFLTMGKKDSKGVQLSSLSQMSLLKLDNVVVLGLDESAFKSHFKESIGLEDIFDLGNELGVYLSHPDLSIRSYLLKDILSQAPGQVVLAYPYKSIDSAILNPASEWQTRAFQQKLIEQEIQSAESIAWDRLLNNQQSFWLRKRQQEFKLNTLSWDSNPLLTPKVSNFNLNEIALSPSSLKTFLDCRQKFFFQRVAKLKSVETESFDVSARERGSWFHSIFEKIIAQEEKYITPYMSQFKYEEITAEVKDDLIVKLQNDFPEISPVGFSQSTWLLVRKSYFEKVVKFIHHEVNLRTTFPELKSLKVEWAWSIFYDYSKNQFSNEKSNFTVKLSGVIDRILLNQKTNQLWLVDYKSNVKKFSSFSTWLSKQEFQLLLYNHIIQNHCAESWAGPVEYLSYWQLPDLKAKKGFAPSETKFLNIGHSKKDLGSNQEKIKLEVDFLGQFKEIISQISEGHFYPLPADKESCSYCEWRLACRAPHL